jgi:uncharacterized membrane protein YbhN (UPF0104 family)
VVGARRGASGNGNPTFRPLSEREQRSIGVHDLATGTRRLAPRWLRHWLGAHHLDHGGRELGFSVLIAAALAVGVLAALATGASAAAFDRLLRHGRWWWLVPAAAVEGAAYVGYTVSYRELVRVDGGRTLPLGQALALVTSGFGAFIPRGGFASDYRALVRRGLEERDARLRVFGLGALEYAVLAPAATVAAIVLLVDGSPVPKSFTLPWAIGVPVGFAAAVALLGRRSAWRGRGGWRRLAAGGLDVVAILRTLVAQPRHHGAAALAGMAVYWAGDLACLWSCLHVFHASPPLGALLIGYATGYALTRRTLPLGGAGAVEALLPLALVWVHLALAPAILAVAAYRAFNLWLPLAPALAGRRTVGRARRA